MKLWVVGVLILIYIIYVVVGGLIFMALERDREEETSTETYTYKSDFLGGYIC